MKHRIASLLAVPALLVLAGTLGYLAISQGWNFEVASYGIFFLTLVYVLVLEQVIPLKQDWKADRQTLWTDIRHLFFSVAMFDAFGKMAALSFTLYVQKHLFVTSAFWNALPLVASYLLANLIGEFLPYVYHRISHRGNPNSYLSLLLWKIHSIHHLPTSLNWFKTNWIHPVNMFLNTLLKMTPVLLLGFSQEVVFLMGVTHVVVAYVSHANIQTGKSFLDYLIVTPQVHHFHHSTRMNEAKNFGNIFPFWDLLLGTYYNRKGSVEKVGVMETEEIVYPKDGEYLKQLGFPVAASKDCCSVNA